MDNKQGKIGIRVYGIFMVLVYLGMGIAMAVYNVFDISKSLSIIIGALFLLYGIFRGMRLWKNGF